MALYSLHKSKQVLKTAHKAFRSRGSSKSLEFQEKFKTHLIELQEALLNRDQERADHFARCIELETKKHFKRPFFTFLFESVLGLSFALAVAVVIRLSVFENYEIPSGSMRPTFKEQDKLLVSKTQFGINIPLVNDHLFFNPQEVKRMGVITFTGENMDIQNVKTRYFYLFPGYKQYIKRMIGLPGDTLYFYGGKIYGIDKNGNDITKELQRDEVTELEHIPFIDIEGKALSTKASQNGIHSPVILHQMNMPIAKLYLSANREVHYDWLLKEKHQMNLDLYNLWGIDNFATVRIVPKHIVEKSYTHSANLPSEEYYLELTHHPSVRKAHLSKDGYLRMRPTAHTQVSYIPLDNAHMEALFTHIYTGRFIIENGSIHRYGLSSKEAKNHKFLPKISGDIPDGTYEFTKGALYQVGFQGTLTKLSKDHPLATYDPIKCITLFDAGIECDTRWLPSEQNWLLRPARYAYFRNGDLYVMGAPFLKSEDPLLQEFIQNETLEKSKHPSYTPFIDKGAPLREDGSLDINLIKTYGLKVPEKHYLALGDNHAMSGDSRDFGFVPESNLRGVPSLMYWAPDGRVGFANTFIYPLFTKPRLITWVLLLIASAIYWRYSRRTLRLKFD